MKKQRIVFAISVLLVFSTNIHCSLAPLIAQASRPYTLNTVAPHIQDIISRMYRANPTKPTPNALDKKINDHLNKNSPDNSHNRKQKLPTDEESRKKADWILSLLCSSPWQGFTVNVK